ncbi:MAG: TetR/AcrR family transcriptional regulator [Verrucomicrobiae bacterium]|nr:TetR/AcrR family transcriptional regulator [Verrucomicrobiae bacterium]
MEPTENDTNKSPYHHGDLRNALIQASLKVLREEGLDALSLRRVAREANVSPAAPYRHFKDKQSLLCSLATHGFHILHEDLEKARAAAPGCLDTAGQAYMAFARREPQCYRLMFTLNLPNDIPTADDLQPAGDLAFASLCTNIRTGMAAGLITEADENEIALAAWAMVHGICMLVIDGSLADRPSAQLPPERLLESCLRHFRHGWQRSKSTERSDALRN